MTLEFKQNIMEKITLSIAGASGYTGMETLRYLSKHPNFLLKSVYGSSSAGQTIDEIYPAFTGVFENEIEPIDNLVKDTADVVVLALPHGLSAAAANSLLKAGYKGKIIDIGSDFRLNSSPDYEKWYSMTHPHPELLEKFIYGLPEFNRFEVKNADFVANPGCFATALQLALIPLAQTGAIHDVYVTGLTGSSGSGAQHTATTHFTTREGNIMAYKVFKHQHIGEVEQNIARLGEKVPDIHFTPVSGSFTRGIWMTIAGSLSKTVDLEEVFESAYYNAPLVRLRQGLPELKPVVGSAFADIGWVQNGYNFVVGVAIDNMGKGAATQMFQNLNLMFDLSEETGLSEAGIVL